MKSIISEKGQVTIPKPIRDRLGLVPNTVLEFESENGRLIARKADLARDPVLAVTGICKKKIVVDEYLQEIRGAVR